MNIFRYIISAETGNILIWLRLTQQVIFKDEQPGIRQLMLIDNGLKVLSISKPSNPSGTDFVRTTATVCVREIPSMYLVFNLSIYYYLMIDNSPNKTSICMK